MWMRPWPPWKSCRAICKSANHQDLEQALQAPPARPDPEYGRHRPRRAPGSGSSSEITLESQIEQKQFELAQLQKTRDQDQNTYDLLRSRMAEQQVNATISRVADLGVSATDADTLQSHSLGRTLAWVMGQGGCWRSSWAWAWPMRSTWCGLEFNSNDAFRRLVPRRRTPDAAQAGGRG